MPRWSSREVMARITRDVARGEASRVVRGTPTLFVGGVLHQGGYDTEALLEALAR
jgi:protein-disulfide isomerase